MNTLDQYLEQILNIYANVPIYWLLEVAFSLLYIFPIILALLNYRKIGSFDYLLLAAMLSALMLSIQLLPFSLWVVEDFRQRYWVFAIKEALDYLTFSLFLVHSIRLKYTQPPPIIKYGLLVWGSIIILFYLEYYLFLELVSPLALWLIFELTRAVTGFFVLYSYLTFEKVHQHDSTKNVATLWGIFGGLALLGGILVSLAGIYIDLFIGSSALLAPNTFDSLSIFGFIGNFLGVIILFLIASRYPESLLISHAQLLRARKLYEIVTPIKNQSESSHWGFERIRDYVFDIPDEIIEGYIKIIKSDSDI